MITQDYFRGKAAQCRRLARGLNERDETRARLLALTEEFEARAAAIEAEAAIKIEHLPEPKPKPR